MILIGGITRLTQSGLSMVTWQPIMGTLPPLNQQDWQQTFEAYQQFPEYQQINKGMGLTEFKKIFWWEYIHRALGRLIGLVFLLPLIFFVYTDRIQKSKNPAFFGLFLLGALQGLMGWYMVKSGLVNDPHVSQYRLTAHLSLAVLIYAVMVWLLLSHNQLKKTLTASFRPRGSTFVKWLIGLVGLMIISGGFMAGTKAGFIYNTFPKMGEVWLPDQMLALSPWWKNFFENTVTIQFQHRVTAFITLAAIISFYLYMRQSPRRLVKVGLNLLLILALVQVSLGILTLVLKVPVMIGVMHQGGAILLLTAAIYTAFQINKS